MTLKKLTGQLHLWLGLATGVVIVIVSLTGALYVFHDEITSVAYRDRLFVRSSSDETRLPLSKLKTIASSAVPDDIRLSRMVIPGDPSRTVIFSFEQYDEHALTYSGYVQFNKTVFVDPYTGEVVAIENTKWEFFNVMYWLHISLLLGYSLGSPIVTWSVWIFVFLLISGLILWWPAKNERGYLWFRWLATTRWKRKNYDLHRIPGFYVIPVALLFALTGLFWSSDNFNAFARWIANGFSQAVEKEMPPPDVHAVTPASMLDIVYHKTDSMAPKAKFLMIRPPARPNALYSARAYISDVNYERMEFYFDQFSGRLVDQANPETRSGGEKLAVINYDLHVGAIGGVTTKIIACFVCLVVASLPVTGFVIWWQRRS